MLRLILTIIATVAFSASAWSQDDAADEGEVRLGSNRRILDREMNPSLDHMFGFAPSDTVKDREVVRAMLNRGEWGPVIAFSLERTPAGDTFLSTSVEVASGLPSVPASQVVRTFPLERASADRLFAATADAERSSPFVAYPAHGCGEAYDIVLQIRRNGEIVRRTRRGCEGDPVQVLLEGMVAEAIRLQPECAPLARTIGSWELAFCHRISGDIRAGARAEVAARRLSAFHWDPSARPRRTMLEPDVRLIWPDEPEMRGAAAVDRFLERLDRQSRYEWDTIESAILSTANQATIRGVVVRAGRADRMKSAARSEQVWTYDYRKGWRLRSWTVGPLHPCNPFGCEGL